MCGRYVTILKDRQKYVFYGIIRIFMGVIRYK